MSSRGVRWSDVEEQATRLLLLVRDLAPKQEIEIPVAHVYILGMFWRSRRLYEAALVLLIKSWPEEALFLGRSLFEDSLHLRQLAAEPQNRDALILNWANESISQQRNLLLSAKALGLDNDISARLAGLERRRRQLESYQRRHGVSSLRPFKSVKALAKNFGREDDCWAYELAHECVHGSDAAWLFARHSTGTFSVSLAAKTDDPRTRGNVAEFCASSMAEAAIAVGTIFGWAVPPEFIDVVVEIRRVLTRNRSDRPATS